MRHALFFGGRAALVILSAALITGCNAIFGLEEVAETGSATGGGGGGTACPDPEIEGNLVTNGSFEVDGSWTTNGSSAKLDSLPTDYVGAADCSFFCGSRVGRLTGVTDSGTSSISITHHMNRKIELGGKLKLSAHYRANGTSAPYLTLVSNGYNLQSDFIHGSIEGNHLTLSDFIIPVADPRRTSEQFGLIIYQDVDPSGAEVLIDCVSVTYEPPPGTELMPDGWIEGGNTNNWSAMSGSMVTWASSGGLCSSGAALVTMPVGTGYADIRQIPPNKYPAGTKFTFASAVKPLSDTSFLDFTLLLNIVYEPDGDMSTLDYENVNIGFSANSEPWLSSVGSFTTKRPTTQVGLSQAASKDPLDPEEQYLADCFTVRAELPAP